MWMMPKKWSGKNRGVSLPCGRLQREGEGSLSDILTWKRTVRPSATGNWPAWGLTHCTWFLDQFVFEIIMWHPVRPSTVQMVNTGWILILVFQDEYRSQRNATLFIGNSCFCQCHKIGHESLKHEASLSGRLL